MNTRTRHLLTFGLVAISLAPAAHAAVPVYNIVDLGVIGAGTGSQAMGVSPDGSTVVGRSLASTAYSAYTWTAAGGMVALSNLSGRSYAVAYDVNNAGIAVGTSSTTTFGSSPLPVRWINGVATALVLPTGYTAGQAYGINAAGTVAGAVGSGSAQRAALFTGTGTSVITATGANGSYMTTAYGINDAGLIVGNGVDPTNAALNVGMVYDSVTGTMTTVGALPGANGALNFGVSNNGYVVGSSMFNQGSGNSFIWSATAGMTLIPLPAGTSQGSARAVNDSGWAVGTAGGLYAVPYLYADGTTYTLQSLLQNGTGWDLSTNTSSSALGIGDNGSIVGTAVHNGLTHAYEMTLVTAVPEPASWASMLGGLAAVSAALRRRRRLPVRTTVGDAALDAADGRGAATRDC